MAWVCLYLTPWAKRGRGDKGKCAHEWQGSCLDLISEGIARNIHWNAP